MMKKLALIASILFLPGVLFGQSTLNFPRTLSTSDLTTTGFAVVNPGSIDASLTISLLSANGTLVAFSNQVVRAQGQIARLGSEYFPNATSGGWVQVNSTVSGLQGFWIGGDFSTNTDGAAGAVSASDQILPLVVGQTEIDIANPGTTPISVTIHCITAIGEELAAPVTQTIAASGAFQSQASVLFPNIIPCKIDSGVVLHITSTGVFAATSVIGSFLVPHDTGVVNGVDTTVATLELDFPHVVYGPLGSLNYITAVGVANLTSSAQTVTISFMSQSGGSPISVQRSLPANGSLREGMQSLFNFTGFQDGWIQVTGTAPMTGYIAYAESTGGGFAVAPVQVTPRTNLLFLQVADLPPWSTGIALLNTTNTAANVEVYALYPDGSLIGGPSTSANASFTLNPGQKIAKLLDPELMSAPVNGGFVWVRTTNNVPLYGLELFFAQNNSFMANVGAGTTPPGVNFVPPPMQH
jgi:hypothetical protein